VRIADVYPTGDVRLLQDNAIRMRWRQGGLDPVWMEKDAVYEVTISLWNTSYVVAPGHSLRFAITSSNYPRFDVNRNNGILLANQTTNDANITAHNTVFHSSKFPSYVSLPVVKKAQLPAIPDIKAMFTAAYPQLDADKIIDCEFCVPLCDWLVSIHLIFYACFKQLSRPELMLSLSIFRAWCAFISTKFLYSIHIIFLYFN
jgi:hypothetical protein